jgi:Tol biopolymer transport system component
MAQAFDPEKLELLGEPYRVATGIPSIFETGYFSATSTVLVYRTTSSLNAFGLVWFDREGKQQESVGEGGDIGRPSLSPDGTRVVYAIGTHANTDEDIWVLDLARGVSSRLTFGGSSNNYPLWSPDGSEIVFSSNREGRYNMYLKPANGAKEEELLLRSDENKRPESWSRDGRYLLYATSKSNFSAEQLWVLPMQGDRTPFPFARTRFDETTAEFSPDGRWIAYATNETGGYEVYVREFTPPPGATESGGKWQISKDGGVRPIWRSDGKEMSYVDATNDRQMSVSLDYTGGFHAGVPRTLFQEHAPGFGVTATHDLKRFLLVVPAQQKGPQVFDVMVNWAAGLQK